MERKMRRFKQLLSDQMTEDILSRATNGVLSLVDTDGAPYGVPLSFAYDSAGCCIYFHSAVNGRKIDCIGADSRCSFCVVDEDRILPEKFTTCFRSVIASGRIHIVTEPQEVTKGLLLMCDKYSPGIDPTAEISGCRTRVAVMRLDIESMAGKEAIEFVRERKDQ